MRRAEVISKLRCHLADLTSFGVRHIDLFGSVARDEARPDSDLDVVVEFDGPVTFDAFIGLALFLEDLFDCQVDLTTWASLKPRVRNMVEREAVRVA